MNTVAVAVASVVVEVKVAILLHAAEISCGSQPIAAAGVAAATALFLATTNTVWILVTVVVATTAVATVVASDVVNSVLVGGSDVITVVEVVRATIEMVAVVPTVVSGATYPMYETQNSRSWGELSSFGGSAGLVGGEAAEACEQTPGFVASEATKLFRMVYWSLPRHCPVLTAKVASHV